MPQTKWIILKASVLLLTKIKIEDDLFHKCTVLLLEQRIPLAVSEARPRPEMTLVSQKHRTSDGGTFLVDWAEKSL